jgi:DNA (cytosine-5)-methyltransferase 1
MTEGSGTPSSLIWYIRPAIETKRPKVCILENVPPLLETKFEGEFEKWRNAVSRCGYRNTWSTMCAADFGVPQNRKRVFLVSVRNDIKKNIYFHEPVGCTIQAEEHLEETVDEKYYLSEDDAAAFVLNLADKATADFDMPHIYNKGRCVKKIITPSCQEYNIHVCPTLVADKNYGKTNYKKMLSTTHFPRTGVLEIWHTSEQVIIPYKKQIEEALVDTERKFKIINASRKDIIKQINKMGPGDYFRLRRLTPREWFRFMSVEEKDIDRLVSTGVSESQLYKQGGNAIVIKTMRYLYTSIFDDVSEWYRC